MVRPNHDLPGVLVGGIKDYAEEHDISAEDAHAELLRQALVANGITIKDADD